MNNKMLMVLFIFGSVNLVNGMDNTECQLHADNTVKAVKAALLVNDTNLGSKDLFEVWRRAVQDMSSQDKKWCGNCIGHCIKLLSTFEKTIASDIPLPVIHLTLSVEQQCKSPFMQALQLNLSPEDAVTRDAAMAFMRAFATSLNPAIENFTNILEESESQS